MKLTRLVLLCSAWLAGCAGHPFRFPYGGDDGIPDARELVNFQGDFADKSAAGRSEECRRLRKRQGDIPQPRWLLRLMIGRSLSETCGEPARLLRAYEHLVRQRLLDPPAAGMALYHAELLRRMGGSATPVRKSSAVDHKPAVDHKQKAEPTPPASSDEAKLLREKLEAIRSMERKMDEKDFEAPDK